MRRSICGLPGPLLLLLTACSDSGEERQPEPVIIRDNTRVLDAAGRALLSSFDPATGTLVFSAATPELAALAPGHLLASEPTAAAPYGFLRKVVSAGMSGTDLVLQTTPGSLREAIVQGSLLAEGTLTPGDLTSSSLMAPGPGQAAAPVAIGFNFPVHLVLHDGDGNHSTTADQVRLDGDVGFELGFKVEMGFKPSYDPPFDVEVSTRFVAILYFDQHNSLALQAGGPLTLFEDVELDTYHFTPITFFVGPVPVVLVPTVTVTVGGHGNVSAKLGFGLDEGLAIEAGVRKEYGQGFQPVFGFTPSGSASGPNLTPSFPEPHFQIDTSVAARGSLRLYGLVGPYAQLSGSASLIGAVGQSPWWRVRGGIGARVGVEVDLAFWEYDYGKDVFGEVWTIAEASGNTPPILGTVTPKAGIKVQLAQSVDLHAVAGDLQDGWFCCTRTWTSDKEGALGTEGPFGMKHTFTLAGVHHLTVTATDSAGAQVTGTTTVEVVNTPPAVSLVKPTPGATWYRGAPLFIHAWATDGNQPCPSLARTWSSSLGDPMPAASCTAPVTVTFATNGTRTLTFTATDAQQASTSKSVSVVIVDPPANIPPDLFVSQPAPGAGFNDSSQVEVVAQVLDPDNPALTYSLSVANALGVAQITSGAVPGDATQGPIFTISFSASAHLLCAGNTPNTLELLVADGTGGHIVSYSVPVTCTYLPK